MWRTHYSRDITPEMDGEKVTVAGWIYEIRDLGGIKFLLLRDRKGHTQITVVKNQTPEDVLNTVDEITKETVVSVTGVVKKMDKAPNGYEIIPENIIILNKSETPLPMDLSGKIKSEFDTRLDSRFLDLRFREVQAVFYVKQGIMEGIRKYMKEHEFLEINAPKIVGAGAEGGATLFPITYFGQEAYLCQSIQLYKQMMMATGVDRVFEIGPTYRAEESDTTRHLSEFWTWDVEMAFITNEKELTEHIEGTIKTVLEHVKENYQEDLEILGIDITVPKKIPEHRYTEVLEVLKNYGKEIPYGADLDTESEKLLGKYAKEELDSDFLFVYGYPAEERAFYYMRDENNPELTKSFDLIYKGEEVISGGQREHRYDVLVQEMERRNMNVESFEFYLKAFKYGIPPHGGWGMGLERFVKQLLGLRNIREAILFPRDRKRLIP